MNYSIISDRYQVLGTDKPNWSWLRGLGGGGREKGKLPKTKTEKGKLPETKREKGKEQPANI